MDFYCFRCNKEFASSREAIVHLKKIHFLIDNTDPIKCVVKNCTKTYNTFKGLAAHVKAVDHKNVREMNVCHISTEKRMKIIIH